MVYRKINRENSIMEELEDSTIIINDDSIHLLNKTAALIMKYCENADNKQIFNRVKKQLQEKNITIDDKLLSDVKTCLSHRISMGLIAGE